MKPIAVTLSLALLITQSTFAIAYDKPAACPRLGIIKSVGIDRVYYEPNFGWLATTTYAKYDTDVLWSFSVLVGKSPANESKALEKAKTDLEALNWQVGPMRYTQSDETLERWCCTYHGSGTAIAITPTLPDNLSLILSYFH
jgi:hypothetical protein